MRSNRVCSVLFFCLFGVFFLQLIRKILNQFTDLVLTESLEVHAQDVSDAAESLPSSESGDLSEINNAASRSSAGPSF